MIVSEALGVVGIITGVIILISTLIFVYLMLLASKYGSRTEANKFFGSYMLNNPKRYMFAFACLVAAAISLSTGFIISFVASFFLNPLVVWEIAGIISLISLALFFVAFTSMDNTKSFINYINFLKNRKIQSSLK